ncbi:MAG: hypothetical protein HY782_19730 [Chloroflexi bacterium]|nr:hypothetical protein [Chloroflexota bacterium]
MFSNKTLPTAVVLALGMLFFLANAMAVKAAEPNGIIRPSEGGIVSGLIPVTGVADEPDFLAWQLDLLPLAEPETAIFVQRGETRHPVLGRIGSLDTALYPNGEYRLRLRVIRKDGNYSEYLSTILIDNGPLGSNRITDPLDGTALACLTSVRGIAHAPDFRNWQLDLLPGGVEDKSVMLARGSQPRFSQGNLTEFDTTPFPDGNHLLRLRVVHLDGNYDQYYTPVAINNSILAAALSLNACSCARANSDVVSAEPNMLTYPLNAMTVRGVVPVCGKADDPNFQAWQVDLLFDGDENTSVLIAHGETSTVAKAPLMLFDTSALPDGKYGLRLRVGRLDETIDSHTILLCVANNGVTANCASR